MNGRKSGPDSILPYTTARAVSMICPIIQYPLRVYNSLTLPPPPPPDRFTRI
jgi:hypothetical protein